MYFGSDYRFWRLGIGSQDNTTDKATNEANPADDSTERRVAWTLGRDWIELTPRLGCIRWFPSKRKAVSRWR